MDPDDPFTTNPSMRLDLSMVTTGLTLTGRYRLEHLLVHNQEVMTWRAADLVLSRPVLIHLLAPDDERLGWVLQAARRAATVNDSRFLRVLDAMEGRGQEPWSFVACEYAIGDSLQTLLAEGPLETTQAAFVGHQVASALAPLHNRGLFHMRLGPDAIIITPNGNVKIVGFLIDQALRPVPGEDELTWAQQESCDITALGQVLYAATTAHWPVPPSMPQRPWWGMSPAPLRGLPPNPGTASEQSWASPQEVNRAISPELSGVVMAMLRPGLGMVGPSLRRADEVCDALDTMAGTLEAEESLERLVRERHGLGTGSSTPAVLATAAGWANGRANTTELPTQPMAAVDVDAPGDRPDTVGAASVGAPPASPPMPSAAASTRLAPQQPTAVMPASAISPSPVGTIGPADIDQGTPLSDDLPTDVHYLRERDSRTRSSAASRRSRRPGGRGRGLRLVVVLLSLAIGVAAVLQIGSCRQRNPPPSGATSQPGGPSSVQPEPLEIAAVSVFDPHADGGDGQENPAQAPLAVDGDAGTVWPTLQYVGNPVFGGLKPGVGLVLDLGAPRSVTAVQLALSNAPNGIQLMVPGQPIGQGVNPPTSGVAEWQAVVTDQAAGRDVTLTPPSPVTSRWVLVYFTRLPQLPSGQYGSGIAEATVLGTPA